MNGSSRKSTATFGSGVSGSFEDELAKSLRAPGAERGDCRPGIRDSPRWEAIVTTPSVTSGRLQIIVCGDPNRNKVQTLAGGMGVTITGES